MFLASYFSSETFVFHANSHNQKISKKRDLRQSPNNEVPCIEEGETSGSLCLHTLLLSMRDDKQGVFLTLWFRSLIQA
jgi:hypothetical protein